MREDMDKVICERPRYRHGNGEMTSRHARRTFKQNFRTAEDDTLFDTKQGISANTHHPKNHRKDFNEHLNPLFRFLNKQVGRKWDDVFSEICDGITLDSTVQRHIREHVFDRVELRIKIIDGKVFEWNPYAYNKDESENGWLPHYGSSRSGIRDMYVDPNDGILKFSPKDNRPVRSYRKHQNFLKDNFIFDAKNPGICQLRIEGIWYEIILRKPTKEEECRKAWGTWAHQSGTYRFCSGHGVEYQDKSLHWKDAIACVEYKNFVLNAYGENYWTWARSISIFGQPLFPTGKRQMNSREIKRCVRKKAA